MNKAAAKILYLQGMRMKAMAHELGVTRDHLSSQVSKWRRAEPEEWPYRARRDGKSAEVVLRLPQADKERLAADAKAAGVTLSAHIRKLIL